MIGGENPVTSANEEYDPVSGTWRTLASIGTGRHGAAGGTIRGKIYVACGGPSSGTTHTDTMEQFSY